jgi:hypothetical protein
MHRPADHPEGHPEEKNDQEHHRRQLLDEIHCSHPCYSGGSPFPAGKPPVPYAQTALMARGTISSLGLAAVHG